MDGQADAYCCLECGACRGDAVHMQIYACCEQIAVPLPTSPRTRLAQANKVKVFSIGACGRCAAFATTSLRPPANLSARMPFLIHEWDMRGVEERFLNDVSPGSRIVDLRCWEDAGPGQLWPYQPDGYRQTVWVHRIYKKIIEWSASMLIREQVESRVRWRHNVEKVSEQLELRIRRLERRGQLSSRATDPETGATLRQSLIVGRKLLAAFSASFPTPTSSDERSP
jgi:hypothetical protein